jgi:high affinity choline transporter 7
MTFIYVIRIKHVNLISATWVGGGFINGSAQETYKAGLIWTQAPFGYGISLFISKFNEIFYIAKSIKCKKK